MSLVAEGLTKSFAGELALDGVDLSLADGEIHALLGPNGSGKSTLIGCLSGRLTPDAGAVTVGGETVDRFTPRAAFAAGTAVIYQHFSLIPPLSVADNVFLGSELKERSGRIARTRQVTEARALLTRLGAALDTRVPVSRLSTGHKQLVEIAKALRHEPTTLILDEPTAALGEVEARILGQQLKKLRESGLATLYVTHLLSEVFEIADRVTVLRDGRTVLSAPIADVEPRDVIAAIAPQRREPLKRRDVGALGRDLALELTGFVAPGVGPLDLSIFAGEVVAMFGLLGSGRSELVEGLYGLRGHTDGQISLGGKSFNPKSASRSLARGLALVPADRLRQGLFPSMAASDNLLLPHIRAIGRRWWRDRANERSRFAGTADLLRLTPPDPYQEASAYSGGNQQKLVAGRWLEERSRVKVLLLDEPTQGIDVGARADLYELIRQFVRGGERGVLFTSSDPDEVLALADRAYVLARGRVVAELHGEEISSHRLLDLAHAAS